jgi:hypothetical protein
MTHQWKTEGSSDDSNRQQSCNLCKLIRVEGPWGPRNGKGWAYYKDGGFVGSRTINESQFECKQKTRLVFEEIK